MTLGLHLHNTNGMALANALAGMLSGVGIFEGSIGGIGGGIRMPYGIPHYGNVSTEDLAHMFSEMGSRDRHRAARVAGRRSPRAGAARVGADIQPRLARRDARRTCSSRVASLHATDEDPRDRQRPPRGLRRPGRARPDVRRGGAQRRRRTASTASATLMLRSWRTPRAASRCPEEIVDAPDDRWAAILASEPPGVTQAPVELLDGRFVTSAFGDPEQLAAEPPARLPSMADSPHTCARSAERA